MTDQYNRNINYLRLSVTDLCNYRCIYCMGEGGVCKKRHSDILSIEELTEIAVAAYDIGFRKIRLTGGEPLVRKGIVTLCENIRAISPDIELYLTTNGSLLNEYAKPLKNAGVDRLNISLDTLDIAKFAQITRGGNLNDVLSGIDAAIDAGFTGLKINTVLIGGINDDEILPLTELCKDREISLRFIELMPMDICKDWDKCRFISAKTVLQQIPYVKELRTDGVSRIYTTDGYKGNIGVISPLSHSFCSACNRIRITADGKLKPCLHSREEIELRGLHGAALRKALQDGIMQKPAHHHLNDHNSDTPRNMNEIGG